MKGRSFLLLVALSVVLAGCAKDPGAGSDPTGGTPSNVSPPAATSPEQARSLLDQAATGLPEKVSTRATVTQGSRTLLTMNGTFDNASGVSYVEVRGDADALGAMTGGAGDAAALSGLLSNGFGIYATREGSLYLANGTAVTFPPPGSAPSPMGIPSPAESPFGAFLSPEQVIGGLHESGFEVKSVNGTVLRGKPALEVTVTTREGNASAEPVVTVYTQPVRIARIEGVAPRDPGSPADPFGGARFLVDFFYEGEVDATVPEAARRALGLAFRSDRMPFGGDPREPTTLTFTVSGGIPVGEVEVLVKDLSGADPSRMDALTALPTLFTMNLSQGSATHEGMTLTFADVDADGKVSANDTLRFEGGDGSATLVLRDTRTGTHVVPGAGLLLGLAGLGVAALLLRRRG